MSLNFQIPRKPLKLDNTGLLSPKYEVEAITFGNDTPEKMFDHNGLNVEYHCFAQHLSAQWRTSQGLFHILLAQHEQEISVLAIQGNSPIPQIPQCIRQISHNATFCNRNVHMWAHLCYKMVHCGIWDWCIVGFMQQVNCQWLKNSKNYMSP